MKFFDPAATCIDGKEFIERISIRFLPNATFRCFGLALLSINAFDVPIMDFDVGPFDVESDPLVNDVRGRLLKCGLIWCRSDAGGV